MGRHRHQLPHAAASRPPRRLGHRLGYRDRHPAHHSARHRHLTDLAVASYLAKYSTKSTEPAGHASARITTETVDLYANPGGTHPKRLIHACWRIGQRPDYVSLRRWAHMLRFGGHFLTKARRYSIRFRDLRQARLLQQGDLEARDRGGRTARRHYLPRPAAYIRQHGASERSCSGCIIQQIR